MVIIKKKRIEELEKNNDKLTKQNIFLTKMVKDLEKRILSINDKLEEVMKAQKAIKLDVENLMEDGAVSPQQLIREYLLGEEGGQK